MERRHFLTTGTVLAVGGGLSPFTGGGDRAAAAERAAAGGGLPARAEIIAVLRRVADHWIGAHTDPGDNKWARATFFSGLLALHRLTGEPRYAAYARGWAEKHDYGLNDGSTTRHADNQCAGQAYLDLYALDPAPDEAKIAALDESVRAMVDSVAEKHSDWTWDDALHMAMPPFARLGAVRGDDAYAAAMHTFYTHTRNAEGGPGLYDATSGFWYRDKRFLPGGIVSPDGRPVLWSRGNGWVAGAHTKVLTALPADHRHAPAYRTALLTELRALRRIQRPDGFWNVNLGDPGHLPGPETSGTVFFLYATAYALRTGLVPARLFRPVAARAWHALATHAVHPDGFLGYVQPEGDRPESGQPVGRDTTADFGVGGLLLAGTELAALVG
ncbi:glycoside hydrolase family 88 protein [Streptomyces sp. NPDC014733]|uniref:glycoside hydrolase family 88 protein n=1 Tax=Streptomyces sp. NPDC014733 TaxID=3364885 RepID=UPI0036F686B8